MTRKTAKFWIETLGLEPHPEGGFYKETYRAAAGSGDRAASTGIYFLIEAGNISRLHRIDADEMWHFYAGDALIVHQISPAGTHSQILLGGEPEKGEVFQAVVPAGDWFGAEMSAGGTFALVGCTVAPGFEFSGFELAKQDDLIARFPENEAIIKRLT